MSSYEIVAQSHLLFSINSPVLGTVWLEGDTGTGWRSRKVQFVSWPVRNDI